MTERMRDWVRAEVDANGPVVLLDLGCGGGGFAEGLEAALRFYVGIDPAAVMLKGAYPVRCGGYVRAVGEALPVADGAIDLVVVKSVLMHCFDPLETLREAGRVLRPGGMCLVSVTNAAAWYGTLRRTLDRFARWRGRKPTSEGHLFSFDRASLARRLEEAGLRAEGWESLGYFVLPGVLDRRLSARWIERLASWADRVGGRWMPRRGGAIVVRARKPE